MYCINTQSTQDQHINTPSHDNRAKRGWRCFITILGRWWSIHRRPPPPLLPPPGLASRTSSSSVLSSSSRRRPPTAGTKSPPRSLARPPPKSAATTRTWFTTWRRSIPAEWSFRCTRTTPAAPPGPPTLAPVRFRSPRDRGRPSRSGKRECPGPRKSTGEKSFLLSAFLFLFPFPPFSFPKMKAKCFTKPF